jgi:hypothetical protein
MLGSMISATWDDLNPDVVERETDNFLDESGDFLDECIVNSKFEFTEHSMALIAGSLCDEANEMLLRTDEADDSAVLQSNGHVRVGAVRLAKSIILQSNHSATQGCGGRAVFPTPGVRYALRARVTCAS